MKVGPATRLWSLPRSWSLIPTLMMQHSSRYIELTEYFFTEIALLRWVGGQAWTKSSGNAACGNYGGAKNQITVIEGNVLVRWNSFLKQHIPSNIVGLRGSGSAAACSESKGARWWQCISCRNGCRSSVRDVCVCICSSLCTAMLVKPVVLRH